MFPFQVVLLSLFVLTCFAATVTLPCGGTVKGIPTNFSTTTYFALRFAEPPINEKRWTNAERLKSDCYWEKGTTLSNAWEKEACMQMGEIPFPQSEDCLRLNVIVPNAGHFEPLPVVFWMYGGSNVIGWNTAYKNLERLATQLKAIVVSPNYRLGSLGFMALSELSMARNGTSGNYAITDLVQALRWTQRNVKAFGGDPKQVTLLGQSSGGTNILVLLAMAAQDALVAKQEGRDPEHLFRGAISLSASPNITMSLRTAELQNMKQLSKANNYCLNVTDILDCLMSLNSSAANALFSEAYDVNVLLLPSYGGGTNDVYLGLPIVDGAILTKPITELLPHLPAHIERVLIQSTASENDYAPVADVVKAINVEAAYFFASKRLHSLGYPQRLLDELFDSDEYDWTHPFDVAYSRVLADVGVRAGSQYVSSLIAQSQTVSLSGLVVCKPSHGFLARNGLPASGAFHMWDYIAAAGFWDHFTFVTRGKVPPFEPRTSDFDFQSTMIEVWKPIVNQHFDLPWEPVSPTSVPTGEIDCDRVTLTHDWGPRWFRHIGQHYVNISDWREKSPMQNLFSTQNYWWID